VTHRIAIVAATPLLAQGLAAALQGGADWQVQVGADDSADAVVLQDTAAVPPPEDVPLVLLGDETSAHLARRGALALLAPSATPAQLRAALGAVLEGLSLHDEAHRRGAAAAPLADHEPLTPREIEVFELIGKGLSNRDIGGVLGISAHTAKYHVGQILAKVGAATRAEAVHVGLRLGLIGI
jgi:DNA-binding NarL/FixJ family response regulator